MTDASAQGPDYSDTLYLPKTDFPMRAGLPQKEPETLARWQRDDLYGQEMEVGFLARLREERKFASLDALKAQMALDLADARAVVAARPFGDSGQII